MSSLYFKSLHKTVESPLDSKEIKPVHSKRKSTLNIQWKDWCWSWSSNTLATCCKEPTDWKRPWRWERLRVGGEGGNRGWDGWMASLTQWSWVWANSGRQWWTGKPGMLQFIGLQEVRHDLATEHHHTKEHFWLHRCYISNNFDNFIPRIIDKYLLNAYWLRHYYRQKNQTGPWSLHRLSMAWALPALHKTETICASRPLFILPVSVFFLAPSSASPFNCHLLSLKCELMGAPIKACASSAADFTYLAQHLRSWAPAPSPSGKDTEQPLPMVTELAKLNRLIKVLPT